MAQTFDERRLELVGEPIAIADKIGNSYEHAFFSASADGVLVYQTGSGENRQLRWLDLQGRLLSAVGEPANTFYDANLSPDGMRAVVSRGFALNQPTALWLLDFGRGTIERFTLGLGNSFHAVWSPDGRRIAFDSSGDNNSGIYQQSASGAGDKELMLKPNEPAFPTSWSRDGRFLLYTMVDSKTRQDLWVLPLHGDKKPFPFLRTEFKEEDGHFSPDGHWVAYESDESGRSEIYVRPFSAIAIPGGAEGKWLISNKGGVLPRWRADGKELYYQAPDGTLMSVEVRTSPGFRADIPKPLFQVPLQSAYFISPAWDVTTDGKRFLFSALTVPSQQPPFTVVLNWQALLKK